MAGLNKYQAYPEYRDSGMEWCNELPLNWKKTKLRWLSNIFAGGTPSKNVIDYWENGTVPWISSGAVNQGYIVEPSTYISNAALENSSAKWIPKGALVVALAGQGKTKGMVAQLGINTTCNQSMAAIVLYKKNQSRYIFWWLISNYQNIRNMAGGDLRDGLNLELLGDIQCPKPRNDESSKIALFLDHETAKIDNLIEKQQQLIELLKEKRQAVISHAVTKGLNPDVPMKDSGVEWLDEIPEHWRICKLKNLAKICNGQDYKLVQAETGYPVIGSGGQFAWANTFLYDKPSVLLGRKGTIDKPLYIDKAFWTVDTMYYTEVFDCIIEKYLYYLALTIQFNRYATNTALPSMTQEHLGNYSFSLSFNLSEQKLIINSIEKSLIKIDALTEKQLKQIELLKERRTALISAAVTGKIDLRNWTAPIAKTEAPTEASA
ncbi:restriction endonuclease subunit S [Escherichia coli]|nr:restriction endonuclease subunit S [Escherichia coli]EFN9780649.1 restriction endonuclease subunit S [Escherichia coli]EGU0171903.1 restriction endonuclease subunit S [Escherichia coli]ELJ9857951.1 restriction endonuclease subunit S [Escherichia coli]